MKKLISILMSITVILSMTPAMAFAADGETGAAQPGVEQSGTDQSGNEKADSNQHDETAYVAKVVVGANETSYSKLEDAFAAVNAGETAEITLADDAVITGTIDVKDGRNITLNMNNHNIIKNGNYVFKVKDAIFNVIGTGIIDEHTKDGFAPIIIFGSSTDVANYSVVNVDKGVTLKGDYSGLFVTASGPVYGVVVNMKGTIDISAEGYGTDNYGSGVYVNGNNTASSGNVVKVNLDNANIAGGGSGIYAAGYANWSLTNCNISGYDSAIEIRSGNMDINGGTYTALCDKYSCDANGNGATTSGAALAISQHTTKKDIRVTVNRGTFNGVKAISESNPQENDPAPLVDLSVNDGTFNGEITSADCKDFIKAGTFSSDPTAYVGSKAIYKKDSKFYVGTAPAHSDGMNAWVKGNDGLYTETYVAPAPEKNPITNSGSALSGDASTKVDTSDSTTSSDGKSETKVDADLGSKIVDNAVENKSTEVKVDATTAAGGSTEASVVLPAAAVKELSDKTQASVTVGTDNATVSLDKKAVDAVSEKAGAEGEVKLIVQSKEVSENKVVIELKIETSNGAVSDFKGGTATVTVPVHKALKDKELVGVYIDENGKYIVIGGKLNDDGTFTFTTGHFSTYAVMTKADAEAAVASQDITKAEVSGITDKTYTGKDITQTVVVKLGENTLTEGTDYEVAYENNKNVGFGSVKIAGKGKYDGEITKTFKINPKGVSLTSVKAQKKALKATWKKSANKVSGYQVRYSTSSKFKTCKTVSAKYTKKINSRVIKKLKANKRYYVKVRTYTKTSGGTCYSDWSKVKSVKVK